MADTIPASEFNPEFWTLSNARPTRGRGGIEPRINHGLFRCTKRIRRIPTFKQHRRSFATAELSDERARAIGSSRMDERHAHLDAMLEPK